MSQAVKLVWRPAAIDHVLNNPSGMVGRDLSRRAFKVKRAARGEGPSRASVGVKTGRLRDSIQIWHERDAGGQLVRIGSRLNYARMHHEGTKPHVILPVKAPALVFAHKGKIIRTKRVDHPGTKPNRYLSANLYLIRD